MNTDEIRTYRIAEQNLGGLTEKLEKLNRKAKRLGKSPIVINNVGIEDETLEDGVSVQRYFLIQIDGEAPAVNGYKFVATLQIVPDVGTIIRTVPGESIPDKYRNADNWCDHCKSVRRRNDTFVIKNEETGEFKQIGRNCLSDFLGGIDPHSLADYAEMLADLADECEATEKMARGSDEAKWFLLEKYLAYVAKCVDEDGWLSRSKAREINEESKRKVSATADRAMNDMFPNPKYTPTLPTKDHFETAKLAIAWVEENVHDKAEKSDFEHNMTVVTSSKVIDYRMTGLAAFVIPMYLRATEQMKVREKQKPSEYIGNVGDKIKFTANTLGVIVCDNQFGTSYLHRWVTEDGNVITAFAKHRLADEGEVVEVQAKVKGHKDYKGIKQTEVFYAKVLSVIETDE